MDTEAFCLKANESPLIICNFKKIITPKLLTEIDFVKKNYTGADILALNYLLRSNAKFQLVPNEIILTDKEKRAYNALIEILYPEIILKIEGKRKHFSLLTILNLIPKVNNWFKNIRIKYTIIPDRIKKEIYLLFTNDKRIVEEYIESSREFYNDKFKQLHSKTSEKKRAEIIQEMKNSADHRLMIKDGIDKYILEKFPDLEKDISPFCVFTLKLPCSYIKLLRNYILFEKIDLSDTLPVKFRSKEPEIDFIFDSGQPLKNVFKEDVNHFEPYINLRIFGNTTREDIEKKLDHIFKGNGEKNFIEFLPSYNYKTALSNSRINETGLLRRAMFFFLSEECGLRPKEIENVLKRLGQKVNHSAISRDIKAFKHLFKL